jgi:hypothetical protein
MQRPVRPNWLVYMGGVEDILEASPGRSDGGVRSGVGNRFSHFINFSTLCRLS